MLNKMSRWHDSLKKVKKRKFTAYNKDGNTCWITICFADRIFLFANIFHQIIFLYYSTCNIGKRKKCNAYCFIYTSFHLVCKLHTSRQGNIGIILNKKEHLCFLTKIVNNVFWCQLALNSTKMCGLMQSPVCVKHYSYSLWPIYITLNNLKRRSNVNSMFQNICRKNEELWIMLM